MIVPEVSGFAALFFHMNITSLCYGDLLTVKYYKIYKTNWLFFNVIVQNLSLISSSPHVRGVAFYLRCYTMDLIEYYAWGID